MRRLFLILVGAIAVAGCSRSTAPPPAADDGEVTFNDDVAPILFAKCASCHRPGEAAPFSLLTYDDARRRASQIAKVTGTRFMPPWLPEVGHGEFLISRRLTDEEIATFAAWAAAETPHGDGMAPLPPEFAEGWQLGPPDLVLETPPFTLTAGGGDVFRNFVVPIELDSPRWVESIELRPANPRITHHARLGVDNSYESVRRDAEDAEPGYEGMAWGQDPDGQLVTWVPGMVASPGTPGTAWRLHPSTCLVLHTHMQPSGKAETMRFRIGIHFADKPPSERPVILRIGSRDIDISAGETDHRVVDRYELPIDVVVHSIFPHAHSLCREVRVWAELPDGSREELLQIGNFDEKWHDNYRYAKPLRLPRGTKLATEFVYDNSDANVRNRHHPPERTVYGSNVTDEMADVYLQVTPVRADQRAVLLEDFQQHERQSMLVGLGKSLEVHPDDPWSREGLAAAYMGLGQPAEAVRVLDERLKSATPEVHVVVMQGLACIAANDLARAERLFRQALGMDDDYPLAWLGLGKTLAAQGQAAEAEQAYRQAVELAPSLADAHMSLANHLLQQGQLPEAAAACEAAQKASPEDANPLLKLAEIRARERRYDESLALLEEARRLAPYTHPPKVLLAIYCFQSGETDRARELLVEVHAELPDHPVPAFFLGQVARQNGEVATASRLLEAAASLPLPDNWPASHRKRFLVLLHTERLKLAEQLQDESLARDALTELLKCEPENKNLRQALDELQSSGESPP